MKNPVSFHAQAQTGASFIELMISLSILVALFGGIGIKIKSIRTQINDTSRLMAIDALEASLSDFLKNNAIVNYSVQRSRSGALIRCMAGTATCLHNTSYEVAFYREGQTKAFTGAKLNYDKNAVPCAKRSACEGPRLYVKTWISPQCTQGSSCPSPGYTLVTAEIYDASSRRLLRRSIQEVEKYGDGKFPGLRLSCSGTNSVLHGIGLQGEALCTGRTDIAMKDINSKPVTSRVNVRPSDCSSRNDGANDQYFVSSIDATGSISCSPRFW